jgi:hypothetical protein
MKSKRDEGMAQVVEHLLSKGEALNSIPTTAKKKENEVKDSLNVINRKKMSGNLTGH